MLSKTGDLFHHCSQLCKLHVKIFGERTCYTDRAEVYRRDISIHGWNKTTSGFGKPLPSDRQHLSYDVCLEVRGADYQNCSVLYCVLKLCTVISTLRWAVLTVLWIWFSLTGHISLCLDLFVFVFVCFCFVLHSCCIIVSTVGWTWWDWSVILWTYIPSVRWHCWLGHLTRKNPSPIWPIMCWWDVNQSINQSINQLSLIHIWRCRRSTLCRSRWSPYH